MSETDDADDEFVGELEEAMRDVVDPELGINVVDLGLVYDVRRRRERGGHGRHARHDADLGGLPAHRRDRGPVAHGAAAAPASSNDIKINWVWMPPWGPDKITEDGREQLRALGFNV